MHKQSERGQRCKSDARGNANHELSPDCQSAIESLTGFLDGQNDFASTYLRSEYLSKLNDERLVTASDRRLAAIRKWKSVERRNAETNRRLRGLDRGYNILPRIGFYSFLGFTQHIISEVLGPLHDEVVLGSFSGGASTSRRRTESSPAHKFAVKADTTDAAYAYVDVIHRASPLLRQLGIFYEPRFVEGAELFTVPKKTDIDRCACKEPDINMYLQKGVGRHIRRRLQSFGINLNDQSINRRLAKQGSLTGDLATLDLSSASDTITKSCVQALLPTDWFLYLNDLRSHNVAIDSEYHCTEMFSSMGNGFTFELESLIFYALMRACAYFRGHSGVISVYGDDIIIPSGMYDDACWVLGEFGFSTNPSKSFATGPFRESCGGHYFLGVDVTPFYLKRPPARLTDLIRVANQLRRWAFADAGRQYELPVYAAWRRLADFVPSDLWGGRDYSVDTQLVAPCPPKYRLVRTNERVSEPELGKYAAWQNANWNRTKDPEMGTQATRTDSFCRRRRAPLGALYLPDQFHEELVG